MRPVWLPLSILCKRNPDHDKTLPEARHRGLPVHPDRLRPAKRNPPDAPEREYAEPGDDPAQPANDQNHPAKRAERQIHPRRLSAAGGQDPGAAGEPDRHPAHVGGQYYPGWRWVTPDLTHSGRIQRSAAGLYRHRRFRTDHRHHPQLSGSQCSGSAD